MKLQIQKVEVTAEIVGLSPRPEHVGAWARGDEKSVRPEIAVVMFTPSELTKPHTAIRGWVVNADGGRDQRFTTHRSLIGHYELQGAIGTEVRYLLP